MVMSMGTLTIMAPFEATITELSPARLVCHGPDKDGAHSTPATLPGGRFVHTNTPCWLKELITGACPNAVGLRKRVIANTENAHFDLFIIFK
jgi:hypothetical protein